MEPGRWHASHLAWKMGATSLVNVGTASSAAAAADGAPATTPAASSRAPRHFHVPFFIAFILSVPYRVLRPMFQTSAERVAFTPRSPRTSPETRSSAAA